MTHTYAGLGESGEKVYLYDKEGGKRFGKSCGSSESCMFCHLLRGSGGTCASQARSSGAVRPVWAWRVTGASLD